MAIAGGGTPAIRVSIINKRLHQGTCVNVHDSAIKTPEKIVELFKANPKASPYVDKTLTIVLAELLREAGLIE